SMTGFLSQVWVRAGGRRVLLVTAMGALPCVVSAATTTVATEFTIPTSNSGPWWITAGPDGNLWFTEQFGNKIGQITPAGVITEFPIPTAGSSPGEITVGPDGNLWFTESSGNKIGRISPAGVISEFPIPTRNSDPRGITAGPA